MVLFVVALVAIIGMAGLALDGSHTLLSKTRLQNSVDAAALSAAKILDRTGDMVLADAEARAMFSSNAAAAGNSEIAAAYAAGTLTVSVQFSSTLSPFAAGSAPAAYVRVRAENLTLPAWFSGIVGVDEKRASASAVAGPSPTILEACNLLPVMVCGDPLADPAVDPYFGYEIEQPVVLKSGSNSGGWDIGPGNFQLTQLSGPGANIVRDGLAGGAEVCMGPGDMIETQPGNETGPVAQGLNTRFGVHTGVMRGRESDYPSDVITAQPNPRLEYDSATGEILYDGEPAEDTDADFDYAEYQYRRENSLFDDITGTPNRREVAVAIGDCSTTTNGQGQVPLLGFGCFFLLQQAAQSGNESYIFGEFISDCEAGGMPGPDPTAIPGPYIIQLYRDYGSTDS